MLVPISNHPAEFYSTYKGGAVCILHVNSYNKPGSVRMLMFAYLRDQRFIEKIMFYENPH